MAKLSDFTKRRKVSGVVALMLSISVLISIVKINSYLKDKHKHDAITTALKAYQLAQKKHFEVYKKYSKDRESIGFSYHTNEYLVFFEHSEILSQYKKIIGLKYLPFIKDSSYCLVAVSLESTDRFWRVCNQEEVLEIQVDELEDKGEIY